MKNLKIAIIGYGYWGPNLVRNFSKHENCKVTYVVDKLQDRLLKNGFLVQECSNCSFDEYRRSDMKSPLLLDFLDGDSKNHNLGNLRLLCYNCFFILKDAAKQLVTPKNVDSLRKRMQQVWKKEEIDS